MASTCSWLLYGNVSSVSNRCANPPTAAQARMTTPFKSLTVIIITSQNVTKINAKLFDCCPEKEKSTRRPYWSRNRDDKAYSSRLLVTATTCSTQKIIRPQWALFLILPESLMQYGGGSWLVCHFYGNNHNVRGLCNPFSIFNIAPHCTYSPTHRDEGEE